MHILSVPVLILPMDLKERVCKDLNWMHLVQDRDHWWALVDTVLNLQVP